MRVLVVKPSSLGDVVHTLPAVALLRRTLPDCRLSWVVNDGLSDLLAFCPAIDRVVRFPRKSHRPGDFLAFLHELRAEAYDVCLDYQGLLRSGLMAWASGARRRYGFASAREGSRLFYDCPLAPPPDCRHAIDKNLWLTREALRLEVGTAPGDEPVAIPFAIPPEELSAARELLPPGEGPVVAVGFSSSWPSKNWPKEFFRDVLAQTAARCPGLRCWLLGSPAERTAGEALRAICDGLPVVNLAGRTTLRSLCCLLRQTGALLTNDSGPMHIAAALGTPCVALFGATDPALTGPYGASHRVFRSQCPQSPCFRRQCPRPNGRCEAGVPTAEVSAALAEFLRR